MGRRQQGGKERASCGQDTSGNVIGTTPGPGGGQCSTQGSFVLAPRVAIAPTFGLGLNFYPASPATNFFGLGVEFRAFPFAWNTSGFDNHGGGTNSE